MYTKNFLNILKGLFDRSGSGFGSANIIRLDGTSGTVTDFGSMNTYQSYNYIYGLNNNTSANYQCAGLSTCYNGTDYFKGNTSAASGSPIGVRFGDGDTPPTIDDYNLAGNLITDFTATSTYTNSIDGNKFKTIATFNITNTGASNIVLKEWTWGTYTYIVARGVFDTPIIIEPGQTGIATIEIDFAA